MPDEQIDVIVSGAVNQMGHHLLAVPATIRDALAAAGGLAERPNMRASGVLTHRRPKPEAHDVEVRRWNVNHCSRLEWEEFALQSGDAIIFAWEIDDI